MDNLPSKGLRKLRTALASRDPELIQQDIYTSTGACAVGYCQWKGAGIEPGLRLAAAFADMLYEVGHFEVMTFIEWYDNMPMEEVRPLMIDWIDEYLEENTQ